jgi:hypothetical protein
MTGRLGWLLAGSFRERELASSRVSSCVDGLYFVNELSSMLRDGFGVEGYRLSYLSRVVKPEKRHEWSYSKPEAASLADIHAVLENSKPSREW